MSNETQSAGGKVGGLVLAGSGALLALSTVLPWFGDDGESYSGWDLAGWSDAVLVVLGLVAILVGLFITSSGGASDLSSRRRWGAIVVLGALVAASTILIWHPLDSGAETDELSEAYGVFQVGAFLALTATALAVLVGFGWIVTSGWEPAATTTATKDCPECAEPIRTEAKVCRYCGHRFDAHK